MKTQEDSSQRVVALENLRAMCARISGWAHTFEVTSVTRSRVHVTYSNPNEYGSAQPITAIYPAIPYPGEPDNPRVLLEIMRTVGHDPDGEGWQSFMQLHDCPTLWRSPEGKWRTHGEIRKAGADMRGPNAPDTCVVCDCEAPPDPFRALVEAIANGPEGPYTQEARRLVNGGGK